MLEMLKARKEQLEAQGKKGFTLMEMLIVIAIIAILIAIAIPLFTSQMDSAKHATNESNARSIYSIAMADYMDNTEYNSTYAVSGSTVKITDPGTGGQTQTFKFELKDGGSISLKQGTADLTGGTTDGTKATAAPTITVTDNYGDAITFPQTS